MKGRISWIGLLVACSIGVCGGAAAAPPAGYTIDEQFTKKSPDGAIAPGSCKKTFAPKRRGRREDRVHAAPEVSCAIRTKENAHEHTGSAEASRPSLRDGVTVYRALTPVTGFVATVAGGILPANLTPASGRQDHTTSPYAETTFVFVTSASTASHRAFVTIATRPSFG
jgi:hypothetical protein